MQGRAVVLLSGGLDSATAAALARKEGWELHALTVRYGQTHAREIDEDGNPKAPFGFSDFDGAGPFARRGGFRAGADGGAARGSRRGRARPGTRG